MEYEEIFQLMNEQVELSKVEYEMLRKEITKLINENKSLTDDFKVTMEMNEKFALKEEMIESEMVSNLKLQVKAISEEKDTAYELWQNSLKTIDHLEEELKFYKSNNSDFIPKAVLHKEREKYVLEIKELKRKLRLTEKKQEQKKNLNFDTLDERNNKLLSVINEQEKLLIKFQEQNLEVEELRRRLNTIEELNNHLKEQLRDRQTTINKLIADEQQAKSKVLESVMVAESALHEKDAAIKREHQTREDYVVFKKEFSEMIKEIEENHKQDKETFKKQFEDNLSQLKTELKILQEKLNEKESQLQKTERQIKILEEENAMIKAGSSFVDKKTTSRLLILEKNLETSFQKLLLSERRSIQLKSEKEQVRMDLEQITKIFEQQCKIFETEKQALERKVTTIQNELTTSNKFVEEYVDQIKLLNSKMMKMEEQVEEDNNIKEKEFKETLNKKITQLKEKNAKILKEMEEQLVSERKLNKKWRNDTKEIIEKLQKRVKKLKRENAELFCDLHHKYED